MKDSFAYRRLEYAGWSMGSGRALADRSPDRLSANLLAIIGLSAVSLFVCVWMAGSILQNQRLFPKGTVVGGCDIGGLRYEEGLESVLNQNQSRIDGMAVRITYQGTVISLNADQLGIGTCIEDLLYDACYSDSDVTLGSSIMAVMQPKQGRELDLTSLLDSQVVGEALQNALAGHAVAPQAEAGALQSVLSFQPPVIRARLAEDYDAGRKISLTVNMGALQEKAEVSLASARQEEMRNSMDNSQLIRYRDSIEKYAAAYNLDPAFVTAVVFAESSFRETAESSSGAIGLMQIMPLTGMWIAGKIGMKDYRVEMLRDPDVNVQIGCWYLSYLMKKFDGNVKTVSAAYNAGPGRVESWLTDKQYSADGKNLDAIPYAQTETHVERIAIYYEIYKGIYVSESPE